MRYFQDKCLLFLSFQYKRRTKRKHDSRKINSRHRQKRIFKKTGGNRQINRHLRTAGYVSQNADHARLQLPVLQAARRQHCCRRAPESHQDGKRRPAREPYTTKQSVRHKGKCGKIAALFHQKQRKIQDRDLRQKRKKHSHSRKQCTQKIRRNHSSCIFCHGGKRSAQFIGKQYFQPVFQKRSRHIRRKRKKKHAQKQKKEKRQWGSMLPQCRKSERI